MHGYVRTQCNVMHGVFWSLGERRESSGFFVLFSFTLMLAKGA